MSRIPYIAIPNSYLSTLPELYEKYRLHICWLYYDIALGESRRARYIPVDEWLTREELENLIYKAIKFHWFVCRYLVEHPDIAKHYLRREEGFWYYDILNRAEKEYAQDLR